LTKPNNFENIGEQLDTLGSLDVMSANAVQLFKSDKKFFYDVLQTFDSSLWNGRKRMLDMGCGYGAFSELVGKALGFSEIHGIDFDEERRKIAAQRGITMSGCDLEQDVFPYPADNFDFIISFGAFDHLGSLDNVISEAHRVLKLQGCLAISTTNLGSWVNRVALLFGYQPRNLEISKKGLFGVHSIYRDAYSCTSPMGRVSVHTLRALEEYLKFNGFEPLKRWGVGLVPSPDKGSTILLRTLDKVFSKNSSWAVRYLLLSRKVK
jgi:SAM-dependent methyltransferase